MTKREDLILNRVQDVTFEFNAQGEYLGIWTNDVTLLAAPIDYMTGKTIADILPKDQADFYIELIQSVIKTQDEIEISYSIDTLKGPTYFKGKIIPLNYGAEDPTVALFATDVTKQVQLQEAFDDQKSRLDIILENTESIAFECFVIAASEYSFPFMSNQVYKLFGSTAAEVQSNPFLITDLLDSNPMDKFSDFLIKASQGLTNSDWLGSFVNEGGQVKWVQVKLGSLTTVDEKLLINGLFLDVTRRIGEEIEIEKKKSYVNHQLKLASLGELSAGIGHEIKNPLQIINSIFLRIEKDLAADKFTKERLTNFTSMGIEATNRILTIIEGLKVFSHGHSTSIEPINLKEIVGLSVKLIREICRSKNIKLDFVANEQEFKINGNRGQIDQVLMNLISNAIDALSGKADGHIQVKLSREGDMCLILVSDNGPGIPLEIQKKIFDHFYTSKEVGKGAGIGLSIVNRIVADHNGRINFSSSDSGTVFIVELPLILE